MLCELVIVWTPQGDKVLVCKSFIGLMQGGAKALVIALGDRVEEDLAIKKEFCGQRPGVGAAIAVPARSVIAYAGDAGGKIAEHCYRNVCD